MEALLVLAVLAGIALLVKEPAAGAIIVLVLISLLFPARGGNNNGAARFENVSFCFLGYMST